MASTIVVNLFGGPGSGKSTIAAGIFYECKKKGINCELVREYVKKWAWEGVLPNKLDQIYITGKQSKAEYMLYGKVDIIITDCPIYMGVFYDKKYNGLETVRDSVDQFVALTPEIRRINFIVNRDKEYNPAGRYCSEESAIKTDKELVDFLNNQNIEFTQLNGILDQQVQQVLKRIGELNEN